MSMPSDLISFTSTLNDSGMPASIACSPLTMDSYTLVRPCTSSDPTMANFLQRGRSAADSSATPGAETLAAELRLASQRLLRDQRVRAGRTRVHLVVHQVVQLQHVHVVADRHRALELVAGAAVAQQAWVRVAVRPLRLATSSGKATFSMPRISSSEAPSNTGVAKGTPLASWPAISNTSWSDRSFSASCLPDVVQLVQEGPHFAGRGFLLQQVADALADALAGPAQVHFQHLAHVHARRHAQRVQHGVARRAVGHVGHVLDRTILDTTRTDAVAAGHLVARLQAALDGQVDLDHLQHARRQLVALRKLLALLLEGQVEAVAGLLQRVLDGLGLQGTSSSAGRMSNQWYFSTESR